MDFQRVVKDEIPIMYASETGQLPGAAQAAFQRLESKLDSLRGRRMYGLYFPDAGEYQACATLRDDDDPGALGFERGVGPGGVYLRARLHGEPEEIYPQIHRVIAQMIETADPDESRPAVEFYRRSDELELLLPIAERT
jgi:hypothetical protein